MEVMSRQIDLSIGEFYHLYNRGVEKRTIFLNERDYTRFLVLLYVANNEETIHVSNYKSFSKTDFFAIPRGKTLVDIGAYCLMPNHFHILVKEKVGNGTSAFMQKLLTAYTMYFNKKYNRRGTLFEGPFRAKHVEEDQYLMYLFSYIHLNPIKLIDRDWKEHGIRDKKKAEKFLSSFTHSSYLDYIGTARPPEAILNYATFPTYFDTPTDFKKMTHEWISFSRQGEALP
ncbi:MAG: hypothetical protein A3C06_00515 [Candidatus Taylorbacteria bacterium RIFCSPHIGHO2_02_FULL_46_13]|uniref:Transposase IS200-like domain-containing protein n=1 Tax=Candidatus Taylorbacteria bacterium RIFCSPHIGHO2_02_FULL_46_13 TaxID=1802312 RepID=A0A1G2MTV8_9BACT|nr:MAG: hypothetical protein A3C06_00515 [Candidatus Taylorbacteria bacterium RIFCSPHIGHO2_02_FULL_46_13]